MKNILFKIIVLPLLFIGLLSSCSEKEAKNISNKEVTIFPNYKNVCIPPNIAPLNFGVKDATHVKAEFWCADKLMFTANGDDYVDINPEEWTKTLASCKGKTITIKLSVWSETDTEGTQYAPFTIKIAKEDIDPYIAYRLIPPGYEQWNKMGIYQRDLTSFDESPIITNTQNNKGCVNCHSFCQYSPSTFMFHARGEGGATIVMDKNQAQKVDLSSLPGGKSGSYPIWHPSGRFIAFSSNTTRQTFYAHSRDKIEVYDLESNLIIYDRVKNCVLSDPRFNEASQEETFPTFSPDGKSLYFCSAKTVEMPVEYENLRYSLLRVDFHKDGTLGEKVDTIYSAWKEGGSVSFPRISPNGKFLLFTLADCATFPIHHKEADLRMIDLRTQKQIDIRNINSNDVDSYHSWSSNGSWVVLSSKRIDGRYTRLFFAHVDKNGKTEKPFLLPQKDPKQNQLRLTAYNIPEFIKGKVEVSRDEIASLFQ